MYFDILNDPSLDNSSLNFLTLSEKLSLNENSYNFDYQKNSNLNSDFPFSANLNEFKENELEFSSSLLKSNDIIYVKNNSNDSVDNRINDKGSKNMFQSSSSSSFSLNKFRQNVDKHNIFRTKIKKGNKEKYLNKKRNIIKKKPRKTFKMNHKKMHSSSTYNTIGINYCFFIHYFFI